MVLCVADAGVCLCKVTDQKGRAFILSSQIVPAEHFATSKKDWLRAALKNFKPKLLGQVTDILISTTLIHYIPFEVFYLREENFNRAMLLELKNLLGDKISQFKFGIYRTEGNNIAHIFGAQQSMITSLNTVLESVGIKKAKILLSPVMFIEEGRRQIVNADVVFLYIGRNLISFVLRKGSESVSHLMPIQLGALAKKMSQIMNRNCSEENVYQFIKNSQEQKLDQAIQYVLDEFFEELRLAIIQVVERYFGEGERITWVVGGCYDQLYGIRQRLENKMERKIIPYHVAFKQQISPSIETDTAAIIEPFVPGLLATATLDKKQLTKIVNLQTDALVTKLKKEKPFFYQNFVAGSVCVASVLLYFSQHLNCQYIASETQNKKLLTEQSEMVRITKQIEDINSHIREQKKMLGDVLVYIEQSRKWCELFNALQKILAEAENVYLTSFIWNMQMNKAKEGEVRKAKEGNSSAKKTQKTPPKKEVDETDETTPKLPKVTSSIAMMGSMFIGNVTITKDVEQEFNAKFNEMFDKIRKLLLCAELGDIKVNVPENGKITFRCTMEVNAKSKIMAL
ncbi:MAG: hypothetical protein LBJ13_00845 [Puniceicoccales bacterium]|jgi:hypothetical protein|nr:hypothetical protein [Puniceicoccales bacterium]